MKHKKTRTLLLSLSVILLSVSGTSCMSIYLNKHNYTATSHSVEINKAKVRIALKPMGGKSYGSASAMIVGLGAGSLDGPFIWRVEAEGTEGVHEKLWVNSIKVSTGKTNRKEPLPSKYLNFHSPFKPMKGAEQKGKNFANHQFPGKLEVYPNKDGKIEILANIAVQTRTKVIKKTQLFTFSPKSSKGFESIFIPTEIINSFGKKDPTEWKW